jgi:hypothetical protein
MQPKPAPSPEQRSIPLGIASFGPALSNLIAWSICTA